MADFSTNTAKAAKACERYERITEAKANPRYKRINLLMDLTAADGMNGNEPLDWDRLLDADDFNFLHDIHGICDHIDRVTGVLGGCFLPRFTKHSVEAA
jgi:hypothetical protein